MKVFSSCIPYVFLILVLFSFGCEAPEVTTIESTPLYDLKAFMLQEQARLEKGEVILDKTIILNGKTERKEITNPNYEVEFSEFFSSDINRPAWRDKYQSDLTSKNTFTYHTNDGKLEVKQLRVEDIGEEMDKINILKRTSNFLNESEKELEYDPREGYSIKNIRKSIGRSADTLEIRVLFKN